MDVAAPDQAADRGLDHVLRTLPLRRRLVVFLHYDADLSYRDIAEILDIREGTVSATLTQAPAPVPAPTPAP